MSLTITHTATDGTLISGTARSDGTAPILKAHGWRWSPSLATWYLRNTRDRAPHTTVITRTAEALRAAGHPTTITIDHTARPTAQVEADRRTRADHRAAALANKAERAGALEAAADARAEHAVEMLPPGGQPVLVDHYSAPRHLRALERAHSTMRAAVEAEQVAREAERRAAVAAHATDSRYAPVTVANRVEKLDAQLRRLERLQAAGRATYTRAIAETTDQLTYWQQVRAEQIATGVATDFGPHNVTKGGRVKVRGYWYEVLRANRKTVSVRNPHGWSDTTPWHEVQAFRPASETAA